MSASALGDTSHVEQVRAAIREVLDDFVRRPFFNLREGDPQAELLAHVRAHLAPAVVRAEIEQPHGAHHAHAVDIETSRAHLELKLAGNLRTDLVVFRGDAPVRLQCYPAGAVDIVATVRPEDVCAVLEVKASPSSSQHGTYADDLRKLGRLRAEHPHIAAFFVLFDKSLTVKPALHSTVIPRTTWLTTSQAAGVEAWYVDDSLVVQSHEFA